MGLIGRIRLIGPMLMRPLPNR